MSSPYRGATPPNFVEESMPQLRQKTYEPHGLLLNTALVLVVACLCKHLGREAGATALAVFWLPTLLGSATILVLGRPVRAWLRRRHARMVARGVMELEAKVAAASDAG